MSDLHFLNTIPRRPKCHKRSGTYWLKTFHTARTAVSPGAKWTRLPQKLLDSSRSSFTHELDFRAWHIKFSMNTSYTTAYHWMYMKIIMTCPSTLLAFFQHPWIEAFNRKLFTSFISTEMIIKSRLSSSVLTTIIVKTQGMFRQQSVYLCENYIYRYFFIQYEIWAFSSVLFDCPCRLARIFTWRC